MPSKFVLWLEFLTIVVFFSIFCITTATIVELFDRIWPIFVARCCPVAQIVANGLVYQQPKGGCNRSDARLPKWQRSNVIQFDDDDLIFAIYIARN